MLAPALAAVDVLVALRSRGEATVVLHPADLADPVLALLHLLWKLR